MQAQFFGYQNEWLKDKSQIKIWEKSRRIGATYVQAYEDVLDALRLKIHGKKCDVWFSSADITAAKEYIGYCVMWAKTFKIGFEKLGELIINEQKDVRALSIEFKNGARINALSSNPTQFRSKGGKVVLDEFAHHKDQQAMWTAASASALVWGYPIRILSTHNGQSCKFFKFIEKIKKQKLHWSLHTTTIFNAVEDGLADKTQNKILSKSERAEWIAYVKENAGDEFTWQQEYCCVAIDEATAFLSYSLIDSCSEENVLKPLENVTGDLYVGMDVGRKKDLSTIFVLEKFENSLWTRRIEILEKQKFVIQKAVLFKILENTKVRRACIDSTGLGMQLAEEAQDRYGKYRVEAIMFTGKSKEEMAYKTLTAFEDGLIKIPNNEKLKSDLHSVKRTTTASGAIRFDVNADETDGHADRFWGLALAINAAIDKKGDPTEIKSAVKRSNFSQNFNYNVNLLKDDLVGGLF